MAHNPQFPQGKVIKNWLPVMLHYEFQKLERLDWKVTVDFFFKTKNTAELCVMCAISIFVGM